MARDHLKRLQKQRVKIDRQVTRAITFGGWLVLVTLLILIWHLFSVTRPLLDDPVFVAQYQFPLHSDERLINAQTGYSSDEILLLDNQTCQLSLLRKPRDGEMQRYQVESRHSHSMATPGVSCGYLRMETHAEQTYLLELSANNLFRAWSVDGLHRGQKKLEFSVRLPATIQPESNLSWQPHFSSQEITLLIKSIVDGWHYLQYDRNSRTLKKHIKNINLGNADPQRIDSDSLELLFAGGHLMMLDEQHEQFQYYRGAQQPEILVAVSLSTQRSVLLVNAQMAVEKWSLVNDNGVMSLERLYQFPLPGQRLQKLMHVSGDLVVAFVDGKQFFINATTGEITDYVETLPAFDHVVARAGDIWLQSGETLQHWKVENPESVVSFASFWQELWYDGYPEPDYIWQTSSATDQAQAKFSLVPLVMGSIKAAFLAIVVAMPLAIGSAIYTAYYAGPRLRRLIKPYVEVLEAIPSVVIGFLAAIWLLPVSENYLLAVLLFLLFTPLFLLLFVWLNETNRHRNIYGWELLFFTLLIFAFLFAFHWLQSANPDWFRWLWRTDTGGLLSSELKSTFVLAIALGIAIIPTVFSIAEDAIYQVPSSLAKASFAMGASRTQTLLRIVLKVALPGILSALMLGFARAVGETMIVLMVSGNTPVADWSLLESMRSMTANLAIELPEAQPDSVHYQVLFFIALLLFMFTFVFNTLAEFLRIRLRHRYKL
ncbi:ABC transporter permease subunit [Planctobacterium marinum]|uniref:ABC transmembrane type-1 domain-containing protein n=1 Tax=Planctobacterium marinum TaxID=1631968 RepID=A0AA48KTF0_9ALTE|nr:hypothetical protein MACH26_08360 [Planctobacterium marinum]